MTMSNHGTFLTQAICRIKSSYFDQGNLQLKGKDRSAFWCHSVAFGHQPEQYQDGDPDQEVPLSGGTPKTGLLPSPNTPYGYSVVFLESIRDYDWSTRVNPAFKSADFQNQLIANTRSFNYASWIYGVTAHEIGHAPGRQTETGDHGEAGKSEAGLMVTGGSTIQDGFVNRTVRRFRSATSWTQ
jgi:hypothetical protein